MSYALLIDTEGMRFLKRVPSVEHASYWRHIIAPKHYGIFGPERRWFSQFSEARLRLLCRNAGREPPPDIEFSELLSGAQFIGSQMPIDETPIEKLRNMTPREVAGFSMGKFSVGLELGRGVRGLIDADEPMGTTALPKVSKSDSVSVHQSTNEGDNMATKKGGKKAVSKKVAKKAPKAKPVSKKPVAKKPKKAASKGNGVSQNGYSYPAAGTVTHEVWATADKLSTKTKAPALISDLLAQCKSLNPFTVREQYRRWRKFHGVTGRLPKPSA